VGVLVGVFVGVFVGVLVRVLVRVDVLVEVGVAVLVGVAVCVLVGVGVEVTGAAQGFGWEAVLRGLGGWAVKSVALSSVSLQPPPLRVTPTVGPDAGARPLPS
jgi:hypothetical protein